MFCPRCGAELPDGSQFCHVCGAQLGAQAPADPQTPVAPQTAPKPFALPKISKLIEMSLALMCFIFGFLPIIHIGISIGLFYSEFGFTVFDINALLGIAKILLIIQIIVFFVYLPSQIIDVNKFIKLPFKLSKKMPLIYFCVYGLTMLFTLIGCIIETGVSPAVCWYFAVIFCACGFLLALKPDLIDGLIKKQK